jgi:hypothetical protein
MTLVFLILHANNLMLRVVTRIGPAREMRREGLEGKAGCPKGVEHYGVIMTILIEKFIIK